MDMVAWCFFWPAVYMQLEKKNKQHVFWLVVYTQLEERPSNTYATYSASQFILLGEMYKTYARWFQVLNQINNLLETDTHQQQYQHW